jgi:hypothetical protein
MSAKRKQTGRKQPKAPAKAAKPASGTLTEDKSEMKSKRK